MPFQVPSLFRTWSGNVLTFLNFSIVACTIIESYLFPFAVIKWMILVTKYGGLLNLIKSCKLQPKSQTRSRYEYKYSLQLMTSCRRNRVENELTRGLTSQVSMTMEADDNAHKWIQLSYCGQDCKRIPPALWKMYGAKVQHLDLSYNNIETLKGLEQFTRLEELILDNNKLGDHISLPELPHLKTLSLNNNQISELDGLINEINARYPTLTYLSLLSNKACPNQLSDIDKDESDYQRYRYFVIYKLPSLRFLDSRRVSSSERGEAMTRGEFMRVRRPPCDVIDTPRARAAPPSPKEHVRPLHVDLASLGKHRGAYGKCNYKYTGKHSEGNRFIVNSDL